MMGRDVSGLIERVNPIVEVHSSDLFIGTALDAGVEDVTASRVLFVIAKGIGFQ